MRYFDENKILESEITIDEKKWKRIDEYENSGVIYWSRPIHHDERDWNRHDIEVEGNASYPACTIELTNINDDKFGISVGRTRGPDENFSGMDGVLEGCTVNNIEVAMNKIKQYMKKYSNKEKIINSY